MKEECDRCHGTGKIIKHCAGMNGIDFCLKEATNILKSHGINGYYCHKHFVESQLREWKEVD